MKKKSQKAIYGQSNFKSSRVLFFSVFTLIVAAFVVWNFAAEGEMPDFKPLTMLVKPQENLAPATTTLKLLFAGDIFLDRHIDELSQKSPLKYAYPFQGLYTLEREKYDAWIGNLECPVTEEQSTKFEKSEWLKFSCKKEYLPELKKYFDIVSLANNHTDNMGKEAGLIETRKHLDNVGIKYFGHFDNSKSEDICKVHAIKNVPIAFCGFHGVYKLPTDKELEILKKYSDKYITIVMPHQGEEYKFTANTYQKKIYRKMIDLGADLVVGAHPHVVQNIEDYKGKKIYYSLGNFIFDQSWAKTREHMVLDLEIEIVGEIKDGLKPKFAMKYKTISTQAGLDFITRKK